MALRADNSVNDSSVWHLITEPSPGRLAFAVRLALICTLVAVFAEVYKTPEIALTVYVVFFLNKPDRTSSMLLTVAIVVIITVVVGILFVLAPPLLGNPGLRVLTMALISFVMMFLSSASKLKPVASICSSGYRICARRIRFGSFGRGGDPRPTLPMALLRHSCTRIHRCQFAHCPFSTQPGAEGDRRTASHRRSRFSRRQRCGPVTAQCAPY